MTNPYHDNNGKFTSREGMLKVIDLLALTGKTEEYIRLRGSFEDIEKDKVLVPRDFLDSILVKAHISPDQAQKTLTSFGTPVGPVQSSGSKMVELYKNFNSEALSEMAGGLCRKMEIDGEDKTSEVIAILEASNYDPEVLYSVIALPGLSYANKADLINKYDSSLYRVLAASDGNEVWASNKEDLFEAIRAQASGPMDSSKADTIDDMLALVGAKGSKEDLDFAISVRAYEWGVSNKSTRAIAANSNLTKSQARELLRKELEPGGKNYWIARHVCRENFAARGIAIPESTDLYSATPLKGLPEARWEKILSSPSTAEDGAPFCFNGPFDAASIIHDSYEVNYNKLRVREPQDTSSLSSEAEAAYRDADASRLRRIAKADKFLRFIQDFKDLESSFAE